MKVKLSSSDYATLPSKVCLEVNGKSIDFNIKKYTQNLNGDLEFIVEVSDNFPKGLIKPIFGSSAEIVKERNSGDDNDNDSDESIKDFLPLKLCILWEIYRNDNLATTYQIRKRIGDVYPRRSIIETISRMLRAKLLIKKGHATYAISDDYFPTAERIFKKLSKIFGFKIF